VVDIMTDLEIQRQAKLDNIDKIVKRLKIDEEYIEQYGKYKAKISNKYMNKLKDKKDGKLVLLTAINPTPLGEGKTTMAIGLADALNRIDKDAILALREPSMGPVFGIKGGATGGGYAQIAPMEDINLHFTGDIHAITAANNLLAAVIDNHIYQGNELKFKKVTWKRCLDMNDRALRQIEINLSDEKNNVPREDGFDISVASETMAIFCLAENIDDLKRRLGNVIVGYNEDDNPIYAKDLKVEGAMTALLKDAFNPNLVQTLEHTPAIVHGGPFANIAHGCNSIVATQMALKLGEYVITEAGFGADLGAEKFLDIKCRKANLNPDAVVCVATIRALKYHGGATVDKVFDKNIDALKKGINNLLHHVNNLQNVFGLNVIVGINKFYKDNDEEIEYLKKQLESKNIPVSLCDVWGEGGNGAIDLAEKVTQIAEKKNSFKYVYEDKESIEDKILAVSQKIYGARNVIYSDKAKDVLKTIKKMKLEKYPVCIAKTQYSFSDDPKNLECEDPFDINVSDIIIKNGAEFIVAITGKIFTMPGLPKIPAATKIDIDANGEIEGIF
jgi:formate--tetrahydrofolate ligase